MPKQSNHSLKDSLLILLLIIAGCAKGDEKQTASDSDAGVARLYTADGTLLPPNMDIVQGQQRIQQTLQTLIDAGMRNVDFTSVSIGASGDLAYEVGRYSLQIQPAGAAQPVTDRGKYVIVLRKQADGSWKIAADIFNTSQPAPVP